MSAGLGAGRLQPFGGRCEGGGVFTPLPKQKL